MTIKIPSSTPLVGVGLRHPHIADALNAPAPLDFVEVHSENFFASGGALLEIIDELKHAYAISLHSTAMGLGSAQGIPKHYIDKLTLLSERVDPILISDHAAFSWGQAAGLPVHGGDLLPLSYNQATLDVMSAHVERIQQQLGRQLLVENLSAYLTLPGSTMTENAFLVALHQRTGCGLLVDLNNILINARNAGVDDVLKTSQIWLDTLPRGAVGEIHLAGYSEPLIGEFAVDDHAHPVSETGWTLYQYALQRFGAIPTLIEWDNNLPSWQELVEQAQRARHVANEVLNHE